jgi:hypothetical protein
MPTGSQNTLEASHVSRTGPRSGAQLLVHNSSSPSTTIYTFQKLELAAGRYEAIAFVRHAGAHSFAAKPCGSTGSTVGNVAVRRPQTAWTQVSFQFTTTARCIEVGFWTDGAEPTEHLHVDDVSLRRLD